MSRLKDFTHLEIQLEDVKAATNNFGDKPIGNGGFGPVYKGELVLPKGRRTVAFKRLDRKFGQGDVEFWKEIMVLSKFSHENLASLLHFCKEGDERILVYEYASNLSLDRHLDKASLTWIQRLHICHGAAKGLAYLHDSRNAQQRVFHRDVKSSNILLDHKWTAKISDFGLSKYGPAANQTITYQISNIVGTIGYWDPEYFQSGCLSKESDVYSFGVVLFEVMCGRLCYEYDNGKLIFILVQTWKSRYDEDRLDDIIFPDLKQQINQEALLKFAAIARRCLNRDQKKRPEMVEVVKELEVAIQYQQNSKQHEVSVAKASTSIGFKKDIDHLKIPLKDIQLATNNFSQDYIIGRGGYGSVYKGELYLPGGQSINVCFKRLDRRLGQGETEFWTEASLLSQFEHKNLVSLLNICDEDGEMILVCKYASRFSLDRYLSEPGLTWTQRLKICVGASHATNYLHDPPDKKMKILHRDIKSSNILLDEDWTAKVSDFGLSSNQDNTSIISFPVGTPGYIDPSYLESGICTKKSDVYSFGVVLFEVMCGRLCYDNRNARLYDLVHMWRICFKEKKLDEIIFHGLKEHMNQCSMNTFSSIAYRCLKKDREERPTMAEVMRQLEIALEQQEDFEETQRIQSLVISNTSRDQNFMRFPNGVLVGDGNTWLSKLRNNKVCEVISATKCIHADSLVHDKTQNSRFSNIIKAGLFNGFTVKVTTEFLSPKTTYIVSLVFKHNDTDHGTHIPFKFKLDKERSYFNTCMTHLRDDGWLMIELYQFTSNKKEHDLGIHFLPLFNIASSNIEYYLEGIELRPLQYVS
ncbi:hypothetical protein R6Q59_000271 [Mikania micrantha]